MHPENQREKETVMQDNSFDSKRLKVRGVNVRVYRNGSVFLIRKGGERKLSAFVHQKHLQVNIPLFKQESGFYKYRQQRVDQLVCEAFLGKKPEKYEKIYHIDGDIKNCKPENLEMRSDRNSTKTRKIGGYTQKCKRGHSLFSSNLYVDKRYPESGSCKACANAKSLLRREISLEASRNEAMVEEISKWYYLKHTNKGLVDVRDELNEAIQKFKEARQS